MITVLFNKPHLLHQTADNKDDLPEPAIAASTDNSDLIVLAQEGRDIIVNRKTVPELCRLLKQLAA